MFHLSNKPWIRLGSNADDDFAVRCLQRTARLSPSLRLSTFKEHLNGSNQKEWLSCFSLSTTLSVGPSFV